MKTSNTKRLVGIAMFGAIAYVLMFFAFPILPSATFLKIDFSDIPILLGMFLYGPVGGIFIALIRSVLHYIQTGGDLGYPIGDVASFVATLTYAFPIYWLINKQLTKQKLGLPNMVMANMVGTVSMTVVMSIANWFVITPLYLAVMGFNVGPIKDYVLLGIVPFNIIKGLLVSVIFIFMFSTMQSWIVKNQTNSTLYK